MAKVEVVQNLGWLDRVIRVVIGIAFLSVPCYYLFSGMSSPWYTYLMLLAVYPLMTGMLGRDLLYDLFSVKSCGTSERNQCGTFPYEIDAALGHHPIPDSEVEHSLERSHHV